MRWICRHGGQLVVGIIRKASAIFQNSFDHDAQRNRSFLTTPAMMDCVFATEYNRCSKKTTLLDYSRFISQNKDLATTGITQSACFMTFVNLFQLCDTHERQV